MLAEHSFNSEKEYLIYLRDYMAIQYMKANCDNEEKQPGTIAKEAYEMAVHMLNQRGMRRRLEADK